MNDITEALAEWKGQTITRGQLLRRLLEYENWMMPMNAGVDSFGPFTLALARLIPDAEGRARLLLFADGDAQEAFAAQHEATGGIGFANPTGWEVFSVALDGVATVVLDPGAAHELVIEAAEFAEITELAAAIGIEAVWRRLRAGEEEPEDLRRAALYPGYHLAVAKRDGEKWIFCEVTNDDGRGYVALFTHGAALDLGWPEIGQRYATEDPRATKAGGPEIFPRLAGEPTAGLVLDYNGPGAPAVFTREVFDLLVAELKRANH
ncbi:MAG: hypothetical protein ABIP20_01635 [Chthoniobacteraceae bacterium]